MIPSTRNYCTVGDHSYSGKENVVQYGKFQGHGACAPCFVTATSEAATERDQQRRAQRQDLERKKAAWDRERREGMDASVLTSMEDLTMSKPKEDKSVENVPVRKDSKEASSSEATIPKASKEAKPKSKFFYTLIKRYCPICHSGWEACKKPVEHKAKYAEYLKAVP